MTIDYLRQRAFFDPANHDAAVTVVGCGGIGSFTALALAKLGVQKMHLIDFDIVEEHNLPNQMFSTAALGQYKVEALAEAIQQTNPECAVTLTSMPFGELARFPLNPIVVAGLDSMEARAELWQKVRMKMPVKLFLDGRLAGQKIVLYSVKPTYRPDIVGYEASLYSDAEAIDDSCTARSIIDVGFTVAALMTRSVRLAYTSEDRQSPVTYLNQETLEIAKGEWL